VCIKEFGVQRNRAIVGVVVAAVVVAGIAYYGGRRTGLQEARGAAETAPAKADATATAKPSGTGAKASTGSTVRAVSTAHGNLDSAASNGSATALPPPGTPLAEIFDELKRRADAGDAAAASRLFQDLQRCAEAQRLGHYLPAIANRALEGNLPSSPDELERSDRQLDRLQRGLEFQQNTQAMCAGVSSNQLAALVPTTLAAAQLGDPQAADCYVGANLNAWPDVLNNPGWVSEYKNNALPLANAALQRGDWTMVALLASANAGGIRNNNMLNQVTGSDPQQAYTYAKLMSLGQPPGTPPSSRSTNALSTLSSQLTPEQIQAGDTQAQSMYQQYFNAAPRQTGQVANSMRACQAGF
jgi:hypothetical protein